MSIVVQHRRDTTTNVEANTPAAGELWWDVTKNEMGMGNGTVAGGMRQQKKNIREPLAPAQITANTNDYSPTGLKHAAVLRLTTDISRNLTGLVPLTVSDTADGRQITLYNAGAANLVVQDQNAASAAANRFDLGGSDITLAPKQSITLRYSNTITRWEIADGTYGQAIADGAVSARKLAASSQGAFVGMVNGTIVESHTGNAVTYALKTLAGVDPSATDPVLMAFQTGAGAFVVRSVTAALSVTVSAGSTLGSANAVPIRVWLVALDNAGTVALGAINCRSGSSILSLDEWLASSTTAEGGAGAADSAQVIYTASALTSKYLCLVGFADYDSGLATAGNWAASPTRLSLFGTGVPRPGMATGRRAQTVITAASATTTSFADVSGLAASVNLSTPQNLLDVRYNVSVGSDPAAVNTAVLLLRGAVAVRLGDAAGSRVQASGAAPAAFTGGVASVSGYFRDFPGAAGNTTYKIQARVDTNTGTINKSFQDANTAVGLRTASDIDVQEIMG